MRNIIKNHVIFKKANLLGENQIIKKIKKNKMEDYKIEDLIAEAKKDLTDFLLNIEDKRWGHFGKYRNAGGDIIVLGEEAVGDVVETYLEPFLEKIHFLENQLKHKEKIQKEVKEYHNTFTKILEDKQDEISSLKEQISIQEGRIAHYDALTKEQSETTAQAISFAHDTVKETDKREDEINNNINIFKELKKIRKNTDLLEKKLKELNLDNNNTEESEVGGGGSGVGDDLKVRLDTCGLSKLEELCKKNRIEAKQKEEWELESEEEWEEVQEENRKVMIDLLMKESEKRSFFCDVEEVKKPLTSLSQFDLGFLRNDENNNPTTLEPEWIQILDINDDKGQRFSPEWKKILNFKEGDNVPILTRFAYWCFGNYSDSDFTTVEKKMFVENAWTGGEITEDLVKMVRECKENMHQQIESLQNFLKRKGSGLGSSGSCCFEMVPKPSKPGYFVPQLKECDIEGHPEGNEDSRVQNELLKRKRGETLKKEKNQLKKPKITEGEGSKDVESVEEGEISKSKFIELGLVYKGIYKIKGKFKVQFLPVTGEKAIYLGSFSKKKEAQKAIRVYLRTKGKKHVDFFKRK